MAFRKLGPGPYDKGSFLKTAPWTAGALALPPFILAQARPDVALGAIFVLLLLGLFDFLSRSKKKEPAPPSNDGQKDDGPDPDLEGTDPADEAAPGPPPGMIPGKKKKKGDEPPRPRPRRADYTGHRVSVFIPGRKAETAARPPEPSATQEKPAAPDAAACPGCGKPPERPGGFCTECERKNRVTEVENLVSSLKTKEVNMLPAERYLFQARSALAVSAWKDVLRLTAQAEAAAREQEADFEEGQRILARCEESIASAIEAGRNTIAAEKAFRKATMLFKQGKYTDCMEEAVLIPTLIMDRPRPRVVPAGTVGEPAGAGETPGGSPTPSATPSGPAGGDPSGPGMVRCQSCGQKINREKTVCPACGKPTAPHDETSSREGRACPTCGEPLDPGWDVCPACNTPAAEDPDASDGSCHSCGREVLPSWTMCPFCDAKLKDDGSAMKVRKGFARPDRPVPTIPPVLREKGVLAQIEEVDRLLDEAKRRGLDVRKAQNLLELAVNFTRNGNYDKGERYVRKAKNVAETLLAPFD
jgi:predicted amidophosphoribosyltransferase